MLEPREKASNLCNCYWRCKTSQVCSVFSCPHYFKAGSLPSDRQGACSFELCNVMLHGLCRKLEIYIVKLAAPGKDSRSFLGSPHTADSSFGTQTLTPDASVKPRCETFHWQGRSRSEPTDGSSQEQALGVYRAAGSARAEVQLLHRIAAKYVQAHFLGGLLGFSHMLYSWNSELRVSENYGPPLCPQI